MQPTYPGQFPSVGRDIQNVVVPIDLANVDDVQFVAKYLYAFIKRLIPVRFGLVLTANTEESKAQAKIAHYLHQAYGLASLLQYLEAVSFSNLDLSYSSY